VKAARKLTRRAARTASREFLAEGPQAVREALAVVPGPDGSCVHEVFATPEATQRHRELFQAAQAAAVDWWSIEPEALAGLTDTVRPQGIVARCRQIDVDLLDALTGQPRLVAVCAHARDPGNAGTVIRCADAAGADAVIFAGESVDPYNGKAVRASAGSLFHLPVVITPDVPSALDALRTAGLTVIAADGQADRDLDDLHDDGTLARPTAWLFGNEAWGLRAQDTAGADLAAAVPIHGRAESLNLATAAAVCLYTSARAQRS